MTLVACPECGQQVSTDAPACVHCGKPLAATHAPQFGPYNPEVATGPSGLFPVGQVKFAVLAICSLGIYELYWCYKNWSSVKARSGQSLSPFWRAFFAPLWTYRLFRIVQKEAVDGGVTVRWSPDALGVVYFLLALSVRLPGAWWLLSLGSFVPFLPVVGTIRAINAKSARPEPENRSITAANMALIVLGGLVVLLAIFGSFAAGK